jgi:hypothetical protein
MASSDILWMKRRRLLMPGEGDGDGNGDGERVWLGFLWGRVVASRLDVRALLDTLGHDAFMSGNTGASADAVQRLEWVLYGIRTLGFHTGYNVYCFVYHDLRLICVHFQRSCVFLLVLRKDNYAKVGSIMVRAA